MKKLSRIIATLILLFILTEAKAAKILGSETSWTCLGNDTFEITVTAYISCVSGGTAFAPVAPVVISDSCANTLTPSVGSYYAWTIDDVTPLCKTATPICAISGGSGIGTTAIPDGIERHIFKYKVFLGGAFANCCWYRINWQFCCRTSIITTGLAGTDLINSSILNRCTAGCNSSPKFNSIPVIIACSGNDYYFSQKATDAEGDSLSFALVEPSGGTFNSPWTYKYPFTCLGGNNPNINANPPTGFNIIPTSGDLAFRPMQVQISIAAIEVTEWRKIGGVSTIIGKCQRDMEIMTVQNCNNKNPSLSGPFSYEACSGQQFCITINTSDQDLADTTRLSWNNGIPSATWTTNNGTARHATGTLCWTPTSADASTVPYSFTVSTVDDHCPMPGSITRSYMITVKPTPENTRTYRRITCTLVEFKATPKSSAFDNATYKWYVPRLVGQGQPLTILATTASYQYQFLQGGTYLIKNAMFFNGCTNTYFDTLVIDSVESLHVNNLSDTIICPGESTLLIADSSSSYQWYNDTTMIIGANSRTYNATKAGSYSIRKSTPNCSNGSNRINVYEISGLIIIRKPVPLCIGDSVIYKVIGKMGSTYEWYRNGRLINGANSEEFVVKQDGSYNAKIIHPSCTSITNIDTVQFLPLPVKPVITQNNTLLTSSTSASYQWYRDGIILSGATGISYNAIQTGTYKVKVTGANGCSNISDPYNFKLGIKSNATDPGFKISPNPFHNQLKIEVLSSGETVMVALYSIQGKLILKQEESNTGSLFLDTKDLSAGFYFLEINEGKDHAFFKIEKE
jgi:hypothetical protein